MKQASFTLRAADSYALQAMTQAAWTLDLHVVVRGLVVRVEGPAAGVESFERYLERADLRPVDRALRRGLLARLAVLLRSAA